MVKIEYEAKVFNKFEIERIDDFRKLGDSAQSLINEVTNMIGKLDDNGLYNDYDELVLKSIVTLATNIINMTENRADTLECGWL